jgi:hypothetical protein
MNKENQAFLELARKFKDDKPLSQMDLKIIDRWKAAHNLMVNEFMVGQDLEQALQDKYPDLSIRTIRYDIANARKFFITEEMIDKDFWRGMLLRWQLKGLHLCFKNDDTKEFNTGIRNLYLILGLHKRDRNISPGVMKQNIYNFFSDPQRAGLPQVEDADIIELVESFDEINSEQKQKILLDVGIRRSQQ